MQHSFRQPSQRRPQPIWLQMADLLLIELTNWRWSWRTLVLSGMIAPLLSMLALGTFARDSGSQALAYVLTGNVVLTLMFGTMNSVQSHMVFLRFTGGIDYFATLPIHRVALILAMTGAFTLLSLPALIVTLAAGALMLHVPLQISPLFLLVAPVSAVSLAGVGALIGALARTPEESGSIGLLVTLVLLGLGPVIIPPERLPAILVLLGRLSPATYAASAMRQTLLGPVTATVGLDLLVLLALAVLVLSVTGKVLDWRQ